MTSTTALPPILVADDDSNDLFLLRRRLDKAGVRHPIVTFANGEDIVAFLRAGIAGGSAGLMPCLVFLDIKMPRRDGFEVLGWLREQKWLKELPVVVLSGSDLPQDKQRARELGATDYIVKLPSAETLGQLVRQLVK